MPKVAQYLPSPRLWQGKAGTKLAPHNFSKHGRLLIQPFPFSENWRGRQSKHKIWHCRGCFCWDARSRKMAKKRLFEVV